MGRMCHRDTPKLVLLNHQAACNLQVVLLAFASTLSLFEFLSPSVRAQTKSKACLDGLFCCYLQPLVTGHTCHTVICTTISTHTSSLCRVLWGLCRFFSFLVFLFVLVLQVKFLVSNNAVEAEGQAQADVMQESNNGLKLEWVW